MVSYILGVGGREIKKEVGEWASACVHVTLCRKIAETCDSVSVFSNATNVSFWGLVELVVFEEVMLWGEEESNFSRPRLIAIQRISLTCKPAISAHNRTSWML